MSKQKKIIIGLTGGIGSGKTTVANEFKKLGITVIDTDEIAREVVRPKSVALKKIHQKFGDNIIQSDGSLNRIALRQLVFSKAAAKKWIEALLHPLIAIQMQKEIKRAKSYYVIVVVPLLFETKFHQYVDRVLVIDAPISQRKKRVLSRKKMTAKAFEAIVNTQVSRDERLAKADDIIRNNQTKNVLKKIIIKLHRSYLTISSLKPES